MERFDFGNLDLEVVKTNTRPSADDKPYLRLSETPGRFTLNSLATNLIGLEAGDYVSFVENKAAEDMNGWFFICKAIGDDSAKAYSPTGKTGSGFNLSLSQATTYSRIVQCDRAAREVNAEILEEMGIFTSRPSEKHPDRRNYSSLRTVQFEVIEGPIVEINGEDVQLFGLVNPKIKELTADEDVVESTEE